MSKKYTQRLPSRQVAACFGIPSCGLMESLTRLMDAGLVPKSRARTMNSALMDATLDFGDIMLLAVDLRIDAAKAAAAIDTWKAAAGTIRSANRTTTAPDSSSAPALLGHVFGNKPAFVDAVRGAIEGRIEREVSWRRHGFVVEGGQMTLAASHPFMTAMLAAEQVSSRTLNDAIMLLPAGERGHIKKIFGKNYRVAECRAVEFLAAIEPNDSPAYSN